MDINSVEILSYDRRKKILGMIQSRRYSDKCFTLFSTRYCFAAVAAFDESYHPHQVDETRSRSAFATLQVTKKKMKRVGWQEKKAGGLGQ